MLYRGPDRKSLAPIYDVMCTQVYRNLSRVNAMSIGGAKKLDDVTRQSFAAMAEEVGMRPGLALGRLDAMAKRIRPAARELASEMESAGPCPVYSKIISVIENQVRSVS